MEQPPPVSPRTLNYGGPNQGRPRMSWAQFWGGIFLGLAVSLTYYIALGNNAVFTMTPMAPFGAVIAKIIAGITLFCFPRWKGLGIGLLTSIPVAIMIFLGVCFALLAGWK